MVFGCNFAEHLGSDAAIRVMTRPLLIESMLIPNGIVHRLLTAITQAMSHSLLDNEHIGVT